jgi:PAS domain S-box-containing protein
MRLDERFTLLIVEDDTGAASFRQARLERAGYHVEVAADAASALSVLKTAHVDLLLLDQNLAGGVSGLDLYRQIKAAGFDLPAVLVTASGGDTVLLESLRAGIYDFVPKTPDHVNYLIPTVERVLKKRQTEFQLVESEARLACIIRGATTAILVVEEDQRLSLWNPAAERMFGCPAEQALGQPVARFLPEWKAVKTPGPEGAQSLEMDGVRADGQHFPVELAVSWMETPGHRFWTGLARDIRDRKHAQHERERLIREQAARLEAEAAHAHMAEVAQENARLYDELRQADHLKDEFLAMLAHELRNPLAPIRNALHLIRLSVPHPSADEAESLAIIGRQVNHLVRLVDDLLDVSRISQGKIHLHKEEVDLADVVGRGVESSKPLIDARRHQLAVTMPPGLLLVEGDIVRLVQVVANLLNNAAKYTPECGRIELTLERESQPEGRPNYVKLRVRDNGVGIPAEVLPRLFDLFTQCERTLDRADGGLGIGLTLVRRLTEMHGGSVEACSAGPGQGSEFVVRLPLLAEASQSRATAETGQPSAPGADKLRVLVVDDNRDSAATLAGLLRLLGCDVRIAYDGVRALPLAAEFIPALILLDIGLPGLNGYQVARRLRADQCLGEFTLVALTGYGGPADRQQSQEAGFNAHLVKPIDLELLKQLLVNLDSLQAEVQEPGQAWDAGASNADHSISTSKTPPDNAHNKA